VVRREGADGAELLVAHHQQVRRCRGRDRRVIDAARPHRVPPQRLAWAELTGPAPPARLEQAGGDDHELVAETPLLRHLRSGRHAELVDEREKVLEPGIAEVRQLTGSAQS